MAEYWVRLKTKLDLREAIESLRQYYGANDRLPLSRVHTLELTDEQVETIKQLPNVLEVQETFYVEPIPHTFYNKSQTDDTSVNFEISQDVIYPPDGTDIYNSVNWALFDCAASVDEASSVGCNLGADANSRGPAAVYWSDTDSVSFYSDGEHVDLIIADTCIPYDHPEFNDSEGNSRFVQFDWSSLIDYCLNELGINLANDFTSVPYTYANHAEMYAMGSGFAGGNFGNHGLGVAAVAAGLRNGFAKKANVYSIACKLVGWQGAPDNQTLVNAGTAYTLARAFHLTKPINPITGKKNPTILNCSWGNSSYPIGASFNQIKELILEGVSYSSSNPLPYGWDINSLFYETRNDLSENTEVTYYTSRYDGLIDDAQEDGVIVVQAAGNDNNYVVKRDNPNFENKIIWESTIEDIFGEIVTQTNETEICQTVVSSAIVCGSLGNSNKRVRACHSAFGSGVDIFAPGYRINTSSVRNFGNNPDPNYGVDSEGNSFQVSIKTGTSFAAPHVSGVLAIAAGASNKPRFTYSDAKNYLNLTSTVNGIKEYSDHLYQFLYYFPPMGFPPVEMPPEPRNDFNDDAHLDIDRFLKCENNRSLQIDGVDEINNKINMSWSQDERIGNEGRDIYGTAIEDLQGDTTYYLYEGIGGYIFLRINPSELYDAFELVNTDTGLPIDENLYINAMGQIRIEFNYNYLKNYSDSKITLRLKSNPNVKAKFEFLALPENIINYKFNNFTYLADSPKQTLRCDPVKPQQNITYYPSGERTSGYVYPRGARVYT